MHISPLSPPMCRSALSMLPMYIGIVLALASGTTANSSAAAADDNGSPSIPTYVGMYDEGRPVNETQLAAAALFSQQNPQARFYNTGPRITRVFGKAFGSGTSPEDTAEQFRANHAPMFGVDPSDLRPLSLLADRRHTQPLTYNRQTGQYKFTLVYFSQHHNGIPVFRADLRLLVRNEAGYPLVLAAASLRDLGGFTATTNPAASENAEWGKAKAKELVPAMVNFSAPKRVIWAGVDDRVAQPRLALTFIGDNRGVANATTLEDWLFVADATTGEILYKESRILDTDVEGHVSGNATQGIAADFCEFEAFEAMPNARVNIGATQAFADEFGDFVIPNAGDSEVTVQSVIKGLRFEVFNSAGPDSLLSRNVTPPGPANFIHNAFNASEFVRAEVNAYIEANVVRDWIVAANPDYPFIANQTGFPVFVNRNDFVCPGNAWYDPAPVSINFCRTGSGFPNTAWSSVVHHEYGHHLVAAGGSGQGAYGEGTGDVMSVIILDDPRLGLGFFGNCSTPLRNADIDCQFQEVGCSSCGSQIHDCGRLLSGCVWSTRNELIVTEPDSYQDILMDLMVNSVLLHNGSSITPQITIDWLTLDDNDGDIGNGTPHYDEIDAGFGAHNMPAPELNLISFIYPDGRPDLLIPNEPTVIRVNVVPVAGTPIPGTGTVSYRIGNCGLFTTVGMTEVNPNEYEATLPGVACPQVIQYFFSADTVEQGPLSDPPDAPTDTFGAVAASGSTTPPVFEDDFETNQGWTVTNSGGLTDGAWNRGVPIGGGDRGDPPTDADGSGQCYLTDNVDGNSDVDGGSTTLTSPIMDASQGGMIISYYRWYSNTQGNAPMQDIFAIEVSDDGGSSWVNLETVGPSGPEVDGEWFHKEFFLADIPCFESNDQFRIRFTASDLGDGSVVEAGVDGVKLFAFECEDQCLADLSGDGSVGAEDLAELLGAWGPNPGHPADLDGDGNVGTTDLAILLGAWGQCP